MTSPKIQRLVTPLRLQRRRHLRALKIRRFEHQKEQKSEFEYVVFHPPLLSISNYPSSALIAKRIAEKKEKVAAIKASHKKCVSCSLHVGQRRMAYPKLAGRPRLVSGSALYSTFSSSLGVTWRYILVSCFLTSHASLTQLPPCT